MTAVYATLETTSSLLFPTISNSIRPLVFHIFSHPFLVSPVMLAATFTHARLAPEIQSIFVAAIFVKITFVFQLFALAASLHLSLNSRPPNRQAAASRLRLWFSFRKAQFDHP